MKECLCEKTVASALRRDLNPLSTRALGQYAEERDPVSDCRSISL